MGILMLMLTVCAFNKTSAQEEANAQPEVSEQETTEISPDILAVYSCPDTQIITNSDQTEEQADTVIFLYQDSSYVQYVDHSHRYEVYSTGDFEMNFDITEPEWENQTPHILTLKMKQIHGDDHQLKLIDETYDLDMDQLKDFCLYPDNVRTDLKLVAAFMQVDKQKLVKQDGSEEYLPTIWFYYDDGSFQQYAILKDKKQVLFSSGEYSITSADFANDSVLTLHRTKKYQDGEGLADYDSTHDYTIGTLDFIRIYPN